MGSTSWTVASMPRSWVLTASIVIHPEHPDPYAAEYYGRTFRSPDGGWAAGGIGGSGEGVHERGDWDTPMYSAPGDPGRALWPSAGSTTPTTTATHGASPTLSRHQIEVLALTPLRTASPWWPRGPWLSSPRTSRTGPLPGMPGLPITDAVLHGLPGLRLPLRRV